MKFIDSEIMERYLRGESDAHEKQRVLMWLLLNLKTPSADEEFIALLDKVPSADDNERKQRVKNRLDSLVAAEKPQTGRHARKGVVATYTEGGSVTEYPVSGAATLSNVMKVLVSDDDVLYVFARVSADKGVVYEVKDGSVTRQWNLTSGLYETMCFNADESAIFVFPNNTGNIMMIGLGDGTVTDIAGAGYYPTEKKYYTDGIPGYPHSASIGVVEGAICAPDGTVYFSDNSARTLRKFYPDSNGDYSKGTIETVAGKAWEASAAPCDGIGLEAAFAYPSGVSLASDGTLYMIDGNTYGTVRKISYVTD